MASYTSNLNLKKPALTDDALVTDLNDNSDKLDAAISAGSGAIAIVSVGNTHAAISSGQYVYVRQHGSLSEGLYKATTNIAANGTLSGSNLTAVSGGGLNSVYSALSDQIAKQNGTITIKSSVGANYSSLRKQGKIVYVNLQISFSSAESGKVNVADIPSGYNPSDYMEFYGTHGGQPTLVEIDSSGHIYMSNHSTGYVYATVTYIQN